MIEIEHLAKRFVRPRGKGLAALRPAARGEERWVEAVRDISLVARDGQITALLGANGAGKTTTLRMVAGLLRPDRGEIRLGGQRVGDDPRAARLQLGVLSDARGLYPRLTARENVLYHARLHGVADDVAAERIERLADWLEFRPQLDRRTQGFSQGERMKTALARALVHQPAHLILDEPTNGLDVLATRALRAVLHNLRDESRTCIVLSSHIMQEVERLADHVVIVARGRTVAAGTLQQLKALSGHDDVEDMFVDLAYGNAAAESSQA